MIPVESSVIEAVDYQEPRQLVVRLRPPSGRTYVYQDVPRHVFDAFLTAPSKGAFFNENIRPVYRCT